MKRLEEMNNHLKSIESEKWEKLFCLLPQIQTTTNFNAISESVKIGENISIAPFFTNDSVVKSFFSAINKLELNPNFDYLNWMDEFNTITQDEKNVHSLDAVNICKCFTVILRGERFCDGYAASFMRSGFIYKLISALEKYIKTEFTSSEKSQITTKPKDMEIQQQQKQFLELCIFEQMKFKEIAKEMNLSSTTVSQWYVDLKDEREKIANVRKIWLRKNKPGELKAFYEWYQSHERKCVYCGATEDQLQKMISNKLIFSKRLVTRGKTLEMERMAPEESYENWDNITMSCYWCNNAKTDTFTHEEFKEVGKVIGEIWKKRLEKQ